MIQPGHLRGRSAQRGEVLLLAVQELVGLAIMLAHPPEDLANIREIEPCKGGHALVTEDLRGQEPERILEELMRDDIGEPIGPNLLLERREYPVDHLPKPLPERPLDGWHQVLVHEGQAELQIVTALCLGAVDIPRREGRMVRVLPRERVHLGERDDGLHAHGAMGSCFHQSTPSS